MPASPSIVRLASTPSTMDALHSLAEAGAAAGTAVVAEVQEAGRGSRGRSWSSPRGGLWLSVLARPRAAALEVLSLRAGLAVAEALDRLGAAGRIALKWPNDLMLDDRKCGGILCEARWQGASPAWVAIGLGLNVTNAVPPALAETATGLVAVLPALTAEALVIPMVEALRRVDAAAGSLDDDERARFARRDWLRGRALAAPVAGTADGLAADGALLVRDPDGTTAAVRSGTVALAETSATADLRSCS
jgi:BirA family transcriptional regulator, biotin operon repressor / biotin---[acetyl-CoA-carboxylase] ligase